MWRIMKIFNCIWSKSTFNIDYFTVHVCRMKWHFHECARCLKNESQKCHCGWILTRSGFPTDNENLQINKIDLKRVLPTELSLFACRNNLDLLVDLLVDLLSFTRGSYPSSSRECHNVGVLGMLELILSFEEIFLQTGVKLSFLFKNLTFISRGNLW